MTSPPETWLPVEDAALAARISAKALRRRIERGTVLSERRQNGRRYVLLSSIEQETSPLPRPAGEPGTSPVSPPGIGEVLARIEVLAAENGRLKALTEVAESTEQRLADELHQVRAELSTATARLAELGTPRRRFFRRRSETAAALPPHRSSD